MSARTNIKRSEYLKWEKAYDEAQSKRYVIEKAKAMLDSFEMISKKTYMEYDTKRKEVILHITCKDGF